MDREEAMRRPSAGWQQDLDRLSVEGLSDYRQELIAEIARVEAEISRREAARKGADAVFK